MRKRICWGAALVACAIAAWAILGCEEDAEPTGEDYTQTVMREIFEGIRVALPASIDGAVFSAPNNQGEIFSALDRLARNAALLETHSQGCNAEMGFLARSVERDAIEAKASYRNGHYKRAAFVLRQIVESCVICHTRLPDNCGSMVAGDFVDEGVMASLPPQPRSTLLIATRQFDEALEALEEVLTDPLTHPAIMLGPLTDYLVVAIRVLGDY